MRWVLLGLLGFCSGVLVVNVVAQAPERIAFDSASVKRGASPEVGSFLPTPGAFAAHNMSMEGLVQYAYDVNRFQLDDHAQPDWIRSAPWDVNAKPPANLRDLRQFRPMLQTLLADRFGLKAHQENRQVPIYELRRARADGKLGPGLAPFEGQCRRPTTTTGEFCRVSIQPTSIVGTGTDWVSLHMDRQLTPMSGRLVVDHTGLTGKYNVTLQWSTELTTAQPVADQVSMITALEEQLGLTLVPATGPVDVLVIDHIERPTED